MSSTPDLHYAASVGDIIEVTKILKSKPNLNEFDGISCTPLHYAASNEHLEVVKLLLEAGADVNAHNEASIGNTPLSNIAGNCSLAMAQMLIAAGADPTIPGWMQLTALDRASKRKKPEGKEVYELLLKASNTRRTPPRKGQRR